jgi:hypothetical protein
MMLRLAFVIVLLLLGFSRADAQAPTQIISVFNSTVATTGTTLAAANASRTSIICTNEDAAIVVYVGGAAVASTGGVAVKAGSSITLTATGQVRARSASGTPTLTCIEERR